MVAERSVAETALHCITENAAFGRGTGGIHPKATALGLQKIVKLLLGDARFEDNEAEIVVVFQDPIHPAEVEEQAVVGERN